jgi:polygalacturonase
LDFTSAPWSRNKYFGKSRPQYEDLDTESIISVKDHGAVGDGVTDDTAAIKATLALAVSLMFLINFAILTKARQRAT